MPRQINRAIQAAVCAVSIALFAGGCDAGKQAPNLGAVRNADFVATDQQESDLVDPDYCFRLRSPSQKWRLQDEAEVRGRLPDAVAGATRVGGASGAVIVEPVGNADAEGFATHLWNISSSQGNVVEPLKPVEVFGKKAFRFTSTTELNGLWIQYEYLVFVHHNHGYQLLCWGLEGHFNSSYAEEFFGAFSLTDGKVRTRRNKTPIRDFRAVGQRIVGGRFESAVGGIAANSRDGWTVVIGAELDGMSEDAEFGLYHAEKNISVVVITESVRGREPGKYIQAIYNAFEENQEGELSFETVPESVTHAVGGQPVEFRQYIEDSGLKTRHLLGVHVHGGHGVQILCWWLDGPDEDLPATLANGLQQIEFLSAAELETLVIEMLAQPDPENQVGSDWSVRNGVYRDFALGVTWNKPKGFWRLSGGTAAQFQNPDARIHAEDPHRGLFLQLLAEPADEWTPKSFHDDITQLVFDNPVEATDTEIDGHPALSSTAVVQEGELAYEYRLVTTVRNDQAIQIMIWGAPHDMKSFARDVDDALAGFRFPAAALQATRQTSTAVEDYRVGFAMRMPDTGWQIQGNQNPAIQPIGNHVQFSRRGRAIQIMGLTALAAGQDETVIIKGMEKLVSVNFSRFSNSNPTVSQTHFAGLTWNQQSWSTSQSSMHFLTATKDRTVYGLLIADETGRGNELLGIVRSGFHVLDDASN